MTLGLPKIEVPKDTLRPVAPTSPMRSQARHSRRPEASTCAPRHSQNTHNMSSVPRRGNIRFQSNRMYVGLWIPRAQWPKGSPTATEPVTDGGHPHPRSSHITASCGVPGVDYFTVCGEQLGLVSRKRECLRQLGAYYTPRSLKRLSVPRRYKPHMQKSLVAGKA
ncbi:hypothetical protein NDU88_000241 [Pleurodeles waltl]|uniref:Uncharacterized protein n=1 Tax=Pleurodeles waltl TaxID=8319 RepID=A0AAV7L9L4_PLEWA|nr:hypothetical protein NDU88_000241 [Pleurodeles waltl]